MPSKKKIIPQSEQSAAFIEAITKMTERGDFDSSRAQRALNHVVKTRLVESDSEKPLDSSLTKQ